MTQGPRINSDDRGFTINKTLAWSMAVAIVASVFWFGTVTAESIERIAVLQLRQAEDRALINSNQRDINTLRVSSGQVDQRLLNIEQSQARQERATNEILRYLRNTEDREVPVP